RCDQNPCGAVAFVYSALCRAFALAIIQSANLGSAPTLQHMGGQLALVCLRRRPDSSVRLVPLIPCVFQFRYVSRHTNAMETMETRVTVRDLRSEESAALGQLLVEVYSALPGFPTSLEQPAYYEMLRHIGEFTKKPGVRVLVALLPGEELAGGVVYFGDMAHYGAAGIATMIKHASGIRLLGVRPECRGMGVGKALASACIVLAQKQRHREVVLHTTKAMQTAWGMYERLGFARSNDLDFLQNGLPVFGFRLALQ
ncbi:MAG TPA: GNAT family N-acetyltransferase, partial [Rudaea sp.]|nr:GNAT family N-acetyltransferase [Rudaea sp.]